MQILDKDSVRNISAFVKTQIDFSIVWENNQWQMIAKTKSPCRFKALGSFKSSYL